MTRLILSIENMSIPTKQELSKANFLLSFLKLPLVGSAAKNLFYEKCFLLSACPFSDPTSLFLGDERRRRGDSQTFNPIGNQLR